VIIADLLQGFSRQLKIRKNIALFVVLRDFSGT
jgi:hypothetical protein